MRLASHAAATVLPASDQHLYQSARMGTSCCFGQSLSETRFYIRSRHAGLVWETYPWTNGCHTLLSRNLMCGLYLYSQSAARVGMWRKYCASTAEVEGSLKPQHLLPLVRTRKTQRPRKAVLIALLGEPAPTVLLRMVQQWQTHPLTQGNAPLN